MRICVMHCLHRSQAIEKLIDDWKNLRVHAPISALLSVLLPECIEVGELCRQSWEYLRELLRSDPNGGEIDIAGKILKVQLPRTLAVFSWLQERMAGVDGAVIKDTEAFQAAATLLCEVSAKLEMMFPELDKEMAEESLAEFMRGEYQGIEELIREFEGHSVPANWPRDSEPWPIA